MSNFGGLVLLFITDAGQYFIGSRRGLKAAL